MKRQILNILVVAAFLAAAVGCKKGNFLDQTSTESLNMQKVFADSAYTFQFLNNIYAYIGQDIFPTRYVYISSGSGNDYACLEDLTTQSVSFYSAPQAAWVGGTSTANNGPFLNYYSRYYTEIRACNMYMQQVANAPLSADIKKRTSAEARFLRAWYYAELVRLYGGVMLVGDQPLDISTVLNYQRNTYKECIDYIANECDAAALDLPSVQTQSLSDYGRITSGACLALKARMLLTAASPLMNGSPISSDAKLQPLLCYSSVLDVSLWQKAAMAFKAVMDLNQYSLNVDNSVPGNGFRQLFLMRQNNEYILPYMTAPSNILEDWHFPLSRTADGGFSNPSQNLVDQFGMKNGLAVSDPNSGYDANNPYANRDPRFYHTIIANQSIVYNPTTQKMDPVNIYSTIVNGTTTPTQDGIKAYQTKTGYYCNKMANDSASAKVSQNRVYPLIRYAEILLGYAEAINESQGATTEVYNAIRQIRMRAGIDPGNDNSYGLPAGLSQASMRSIIQSEYRVELAYEGHWFYDSRRWRLAETEENKAIQGLLAIKQSNGSFSYSRFTALTAVFVKPAMYFMGFPTNETGKSLSFIQNPGW